MHTPFDLEVFVAIADTGSLSEASRVCGVTRATVTRRLAALEERVGAVLVHRTTRELSITDAGRVYADACRETLARLRAAETAVRELDGEPRGELRIACPIIPVEQIVGPLVADYAHRHPGVDVQLSLTSEAVSPLSDGYDLVVQIGFERNRALTARLLLREHYGLVASPEYLARRGTPAEVIDLADHDCIVSVRESGAREPWPVVGGGPFVPSRPRFLGNASVLVRSVTLQGLGISMLAGALVGRDLAAGRLVRVLEHQVGETVPISLVYASGPQLPRKIRSFVDFASEWVRDMGEAQSAAS